VVVLHDLVYILEHSDRRLLCSILPDIKLKLVNEGDELQENMELDKLGSYQGMVKGIQSLLRGKTVDSLSDSESDSDSDSDSDSEEGGAAGAHVDGSRKVGDSK